MRYQKVKVDKDGAAIAPFGDMDYLEYASDTTIMSEEVASDIGKVFGEVLGTSDIPLQVYKY